MQQLGDVVKAIISLSRHTTGYGDTILHPITTKYTEQTSQQPSWRAAGELSLRNKITPSCSVFPDSVRGRYHMWKSLN